MATFSRGDILWGNSYENTRHPIIFYETIAGSEDFIGCIISHASAESYANNVPMLKEHFEEFDANGKPWGIKYDGGTHLVQRSLLKKSEWGEFKKDGQLSQTGIDFVVNRIAGLPQEFWPGR